MKNTYKTFLLFTAFCSASFATTAQWCVPTTIIPYATTMPGITNVTINTINRTSVDMENYPNNSYVNTGLSTSLIKGSSYTVSITHTIDASICPDMNLRIWIDYNHDFQLNDVGETAITQDHHVAGTYTGTFTVPLAALAGSTRMRVTAKMSSLGGHTLPDPCDIPADPLGYHGEIEDYDVNISTASGIGETNSLVSSFEVLPNPLNASSKLLYSLLKSTSITIELYNYLGEKISTLVNNESQISGEHELQLTSLQELSNGIYTVKLSAGDHVLVKRILVVTQK